MRKTAKTNATTTTETIYQARLALAKLDYALDRNRRAAAELKAALQDA